MDISPPTALTTQDFPSIATGLIAKARDLYVLECHYGCNEDFYAVLGCIDGDPSPQEVAAALEGLTDAQRDLARDLVSDARKEPCLRALCETPRSFIIRALADPWTRLFFRITDPVRWEDREPGMREIMLDPALTNDDRAEYLLALPFRADLWLNGIVFGGVGEDEFADSRFAPIQCEVDGRDTLIIDQFCSKVVAAFRYVHPDRFSDILRQMNANPGLVSIEIEPSGSYRYTVAIEGFADARG